MAEPDTPRNLPALPPKNPGRLQERRYEDDWALLPAAETDGQLAPGSGPHGTISTSGTNPAMVLLFVAFAVLFATFFVPGAVALPVLAVGLVLLLASFVVFGVKERHVGTFHGVGTLRPGQQRRRRPRSRGAEPELSES